MPLTALLRPCWLPAAARIVLVSLAAALLGCPPPECRPGDAPTLDLGKGLDAWNPLDADSERLEVIAGPQGGFHVELALRATFLDGEEAADVLLLGSAGGVSGSGSSSVAWRCTESEPALDAWARLLIWNGEPEELHGQRAVMEARVTDATGVELVATGEAELFYAELEQQPNLRR